DWSVTGVQTCALPICFYMHQAVQTTKAALSAELMSRFVFRDYAFSVDRPVQRTEFEQWIEESLQKIRDCIDGILSRTSLGAAEEIGRASCRDRREKRV